MIIKDHIDEDAVKAAFMTVFCDYYKTLKVAMEIHRETSPRAYNHYFQVARRWCDLET